jgi:hypothetical protein
MGEISLFGWRCQKNERVGFDLARLFWPQGVTEAGVSGLNFVKISGGEPFFPAGAQ